MNSLMIMYVQRTWVVLHRTAAEPLVVTTQMSRANGS